MRQIVVDTETTGLVVEEGHRIIEIGCVELFDRLRTGRTLHYYLDPERDIDAGATGVHGIRREDLVGRPRFADIAAEFRAFVEDSQLIIHNAPFDVGFLDAEFRRLDGTHGSIEDWCGVVDTLVLAREMYPGQSNNLDALCRRHNVDNSGRDYHGALLDAQLLADVYLAMTGGQSTLIFEEGSDPQMGSGESTVLRGGQPLAVILPDAQEIREHEAYVNFIRNEAGHCLWDDYEEEVAP